MTFIYDLGDILWLAILGTLLVMWLFCQIAVSILNVVERWKYRREKKEQSK